MVSLREFVKETLIGDAPATLASYINSIFDQGLLDGSWVFLFDSFDEIPAILSSIDADGTVAAYRDVINVFTGESRCRVVLASRHFRGPALGGWTQLMLLPLTPKRQMDLVRRAHLSSVSQEDELLMWLRELDGPLRDMVSNPLFLNLICEQVGEEGGLPATTYEVFDRFVTKRLDRDEPSVQRRHGLTALAAHLRRASRLRDRRSTAGPGAQMASITAALGEEEAVVRAHVEGLEHVRLMSMTRDMTCAKFAHRRFQEYFATERVPARRRIGGRRAPRA